MTRTSARFGLPDGDRSRDAVQCASPGGLLFDIPVEFGYMNTPPVLKSSNLITARHAAIEL